MTQVLTNHLQMHNIEKTDYTNNRHHWNYVLNTYHSGKKQSYLPSYATSHFNTISNHLILLGKCVRSLNGDKVGHESCGVLNESESENGIEIGNVG